MNVLGKAVLQIPYMLIIFMVSFDPLAFMCVKKWAGVHSQCFYRRKERLIITSQDFVASLHSKGQKHIKGLAYQKQSSVSVPFLKTYAVLQEESLNGK